LDIQVIGKKMMVGIKLILVKLLNLISEKKFGFIKKIKIVNLKDIDIK
jgi:hypothetical protein